jgi:fucose 4-O-acetylase-like acetyltransferase
LNAISFKIKKFFSKAFNLPVLEKSRMQWVDYLRGIAIVLVVYRHVLLGIQDSGIATPRGLETANMIFFSFRMPLFFILSGIFISGSLKKRTVKQFVTDKFEGLLYPYFIWVFIQITLQIILSKYTNASRSFIDYTYILYQPAKLDQFWYLPALFNATIVYVLIKEKLKATWWMQLIFGICFYYLSPRLQFSSMLADWMEFYIFFALGDIISVLFFKPATQNFLKSPYTLLLLIPVFGITQFFYLSYVHPYDPLMRGHLIFLLIALIGCLSMTVLAFKLQTWNILKFLRVLGFHSLYIYVMHVMIAALSRAVCTRFLGIHNPEILLPVGIFFGVTIPVMVYNLFIYNNTFWFLFLFRRKKKNTSTVSEKTPAVILS